MLQKAALLINFQRRTVKPEGILFEVSQTSIPIPLCDWSKKHDFTASSHPQTSPYRISSQLADISIYIYIYINYCENMNLHWLILHSMMLVK